MAQPIKEHSEATEPHRRCIALGTFDGLHAAHRAVLRGADAVLLFDQHPQHLLQGQAPPKLLTDQVRELRLREFELLKISFEEIAKLCPEAFFHEILRGRFGATALRCGHNFRFGARAAGDTTLLRALCEEQGMRLSVVPKIVYRGEAVSSSRIRAALQQGQIKDANAMLGRAFGYDFEVVHGEHIGRVLGTPTLNQHFPAGFCVPRFGVYVSRAFVDGKWRPGLTNIGRRPSFARDALRSETHIPGFSGDLYGRRIPVRLLRYLREERRFEDLEALKGQIQEDLRELPCQF